MPTEAERIYHRQYAEDHKEELRAYRQEYYKRRKAEEPETYLQRGRDTRWKTKLKVIGVLGGRCANPECRWLNNDGTLGCTDPRILEVDHVNGGGRKEVEELGYNNMMKGILENGAQGRYQLLCRCCNHLKRIKNGEHGKGKPDCHLPSQVSSQMSQLM